ncbi:SubName: Full=Related to Mg2 transporter protein, CorA-like {ECO:0000313/EMBL:CCA67920.1} [Serendipita indica DSM 11827]|nr:SubName: Full=Related to Mg2 transporter protein, CorA-like {ECO:0000313/EMBL:CCA67920.1} [Serendipita indica DSM 11827]
MESLVTPKHPQRRQRESEDGSDDPDDFDAPPDVSAAYGLSPPIEVTSPTHETGHVTPGHIVGRPIHESPTHAHFHDVHDTNGLPPPNLMSMDNARFGRDIQAIEAQHSSETLVEPFVRAPGAEPGLDPRRESTNRAYAHIKEDCEIEVVDYSEDRVRFQQFHNESFIAFLRGCDRQPPMKVRWINIAGISWDVISALALKYQLHPLSIEDIMHSGPTTRSKADYYQRHLFLHVLCHALHSKRSSPLDAKYLAEEADAATTSGSEDSEETTVTDGGTEAEEEESNRRALLRRVTRRGKRRRTKSVDTEASAGNSQSRMGSMRWSEAVGLLSPEGRRRQARVAKLEALKKRDRVRVLVSNAFFFLFKDGTVISLHQGDRAFGNPIYNRLRHSDTVLRKDPEGSLLLQSLLDLIVDQMLDVIDKYGDKINESETHVLLKPNMDVVRSLHILSADLTLRKRTMQPLKTLIYGLRRFDLERTAAALAVAGIPQGQVQGYMSPKTKVYLADISDHLETITSSLEQFNTMTDNLIDFVFNMNAHATNNQMRRMTILTLIFLPITATTGYFGMNFATMPSVQEHSEAMFWQIILPVMVVVVTWALWTDISRVFKMFGRLRLLKGVEERQKTKARDAKRIDRKRRQTMEAKKAG